MALLLPHKIHKKAHTGLSKKIDKKKGTESWDKLNTAVNTQQVKGL